jgi:hypothetical protein
VRVTLEDRYSGSLPFDMLQIPSEELVWRSSDPLVRPPPRYLTEQILRTEHSDDRFERFALEAHQGHRVAVAARPFRPPDKRVPSTSGIARPRLPRRRQSSGT